eukprot:TRINITY_DN76402_c0_g1_i1.p3 TRINITY_DN76402_c0_g1~~TRINITY_DN76402_c0_g1_i1.p3  ORF type:complete len:117 (+),score=16.08 TRINITY_DN76402_c0_g1_i1:634-984(+)
MGNITTNAVVLNSHSEQAPRGEDAYACATSEGSTQQCVRVPQGTHGSFSKDMCSKTCFSLRCSRCEHVYFTLEDGNGSRFEDLPEDWKCPMCGAPKSAYRKEVFTDGQVRWSHVLV